MARLMSIAFSEPLVGALRNARRIAVLTGAGISAESGIPTFRDAQTGLWARFRPEELATPQAFARNPQLVWDWYEWRRTLLAQAAPNGAHRALARLESLTPEFTLITQNVDGLHQRAGSRNVIELHGNLSRNKCFTENTIIADAYDTTTRPPRCPACNGLLRPDVVWFGEPLPAEALQRAGEAARACELFLVIGTSAAVFPAAQLPIDALHAGATLVEVNKDATALSPLAKYSFRAAAGELLPELVAAACGDAG
jgi:NAD-dependent deacetylase